MTEDGTTIRTMLHHIDELNTRAAELGSKGYDVSYLIEHLCPMGHAPQTLLVLDVYRKITMDEILR